MRSVIETIKEKLNASSFVKYSEEVRIVDFVIEIADSTYVSKKVLRECLLSFPTRDDVEITITNEADDGIQISKNTDLDALDWDIFNGDAVTMTWHINKNISEHNVISVYCYEKFCDAIASKNLLDIMLIFSHLLMDRKSVHFEVLDQNIHFITKSISFMGSDDHDTIIDSVDRKELITLTRDNSNFRNGLMYSLIPNDFSFQISGAKNRLEECFSKIETLLSICYIANDSEILNQEKIEIKISGQRNIGMEIKIQDIKYNREIVKIYNWIYEGGNTTDKAIIARNIISLHCKYSSILNLDGKTFSSIQSNFNVYQKDNVDRYLSLKNEVGKSVTEIIEKTSELTFDIPNGMKNNILAVFSFLFTVILANIVSDAPLDNIFTRDITVIFEVIIFFSVLFLFFSVYETNYKIEQMQLGFEKLKKNYADVFDEEELRDLLEEDSFKKDVIRKVKRQRNWSIVVWVVLLIVLFVVVEMISSSPTIDWVIKRIITDWSRCNIGDL